MLDLGKDTQAETPIDDALEDSSGPINQGLDIPTATDVKPEIHEGKKMTTEFNRVAWIMENGETKCASCETYYVPTSFEHARTAHCGFPGCFDGEGKVDYNQVGPTEFVPNGNAVNHFTLVASDIADMPIAKDTIIKEAPEEEKSWNEYLGYITKKSSDSELYYRGYTDGLAGKELDEALAEVSDDYFHGYDQAKHYKITPQESASQTTYDMKPNSNLTPRDNAFTASKKLAGLFPVDVVNKFFVEE
jgi:hypothetical protein